MTKSVCDKKKLWIKSNEIINYFFQAIALFIACTFATVLSAPDCPPEGHNVGYEYSAPVAAKIISSPDYSYENPYAYKTVAAPAIHTQAYLKNVEYAAPYKYAAAAKVRFYDLSTN